MPDPVLTSLAAFKAHLKVTDTGSDALLGQLLLELDETVAQVTGRERVPGRNPFESVQATEFYDGSGRELLVLRRRPVTAVAEVRVHAGGHYGQGADAFPAGSAWTVGQHYSIPRTDATEQNGSMLAAIGGCWPEGRGNVRVQYTAGYAAIPADLALAVHLLGGRLFYSLKQGGLLEGETIGRYSYRLLNDDQSMEIVTARSILARYRE